MKLKCKNCKKIFERKRKYGENTFCSRSCSASYNNKIFIKRKSSANVCICGAKKDYRAHSCHKCKIARNIQNALERTLLNATYTNGNARVKYAYVRKLAAKILGTSNIEKECWICGFDAAVEVCHIKPICEFSDQTKLKIVNSLDNLVYLCPNHHAMLDKDMLSLVKLPAT